MKIGKTLAWTTGIIITLLIITLAVVYMYLGTIIKKGVEEYGPKVTGTSMNLGSAYVSIFSGEGSLNNLKIGNPTGFQSSHIFKLGKIEVKMDPKSVFKDTVVINQVSVISPEIFYEWGGLDTDNMKALKRNIAANTQKAETEKPAKAEDGKSAAKKIIIQNLDIKGGKVNVMIGGEAKEFLGEQKTNLVLPDIHLTNLGSAGKPISYEEIMDIIMQVIMQNMNTLNLDQFKDIAMEQLKGKVEDIQNQVNQEVKNVQDSVTKEVSKVAGEGVAGEVSKQMGTMTNGVVDKNIDDALGKLF